MSSLYYLDVYVPSLYGKDKFFSALKCATLTTSDSLCSLFLWANPGLFFVYFCSFQKQFYRKIVDLSRIRTRIVGVEGKHADHLTTTTALCSLFVKDKVLQNGDTLLVPQTPMPTGKLQQRSVLPLVAHLPKSRV